MPSSLEIRMHWSGRARSGYAGAVEVTLVHKPSSGDEGRSRRARYVLAEVEAGASAGSFVEAVGDGILATANDRGTELERRQDGGPGARPAAASSPAPAEPSS
jgi:hypothetical protein